MTTITTLKELEALYGEVGQASIAKETDRIVPVYRDFIAAAPFAVLATVGPEGLDCSPRGDGPGFIRVADDRTLILPDRRGNNRIESLRNVVRDPRVALLFMIPGIGETLRVNGRAAVSTDPSLLEGFAVDGKPPRTVLIVTVDAVFFQCSRAVVRSDLWNPDRRLDRRAVPSPGQMLAALTDSIDGEAYDKALPARVRTSLY